MTITRIKQRRGTAAAWTAANPTLDSGEFGVETDTGKIKLGDGSTAWTALNYLLEDAALEGTPTAPTAAPGTDTTQVANTAFVKGAVDNATSAPSVVRAQANTYVGIDAYDVATGTLPQNILLWHPIWLEADDYDRVGCTVLTAGGAGAVHRIGLWSPAADGRPGALLGDFGTVDGTVVASPEITIALTIPKTGWYFTGGVNQGSATVPVILQGKGRRNSIHLQRSGIGNNALDSYRRDGMAGAMPDPAAPTSAFNTPFLHYYRRAA